MNLPSLSNFTMRALVCVVAMAVGDEDVAVGRDQHVGRRVEDAAVRRRRRRACRASSEACPSGLNFMTVWPLPFLTWPSETQILSSWSTDMPCGQTNMPAPKLTTTLPDASNFVIGSMFESRRVLPPQRSNTQTLLPSRDRAPNPAPQLRPSEAWPSPRPDDRDWAPNSDRD